MDTESVLQMIKERNEDIHDFAERCGIGYDPLINALSEFRMRLKDIMKLSRALDVFPYQIIYGKKAEHEYWYLNETDYPVDPSYCAKCKHWSTFYKWCCYLESKGELKPNNSIVVLEDGRHICSCRELGTHERNATLGVVARRRKKDE